MPWKRAALVSTSGSQRSGCRLSYVDGLPCLVLARWLVLGIKCDHHVSSWRLDPRSTKSMEISLPTSMNMGSALGDAPVLNCGFDSVLSMHWKGLCSSNCLWTNSSVYFAIHYHPNSHPGLVCKQGKKKRPENLQECSFCMSETDVCM